MSHARKVDKPQAWHLEIAAGVRANVDHSCVGVAESLEPLDIIGQAIDSGFHHICQKNGHLFDSEMMSSRVLIESPESYREFPVATILTPTDLSKQSESSLMLAEHNFNCSSQKREILENIVQGMKAKALAQTVVDDANLVADELFTNAIYNAPFVDLLTHKNPGISRHGTEVKLDGGKLARLFVAHGDKRLVIGCEDPYGSLDLQRYLKKIKATYQRGPAATMNFGPGGAGIGSYIIFNAGSSLYFGVWPGRSTVLCCVIPLGMSNRKRSEMPKHLHWIEG